METIDSLINNPKFKEYRVFLHEDTVAKLDKVAQHSYISTRDLMASILEDFSKNQFSSTLEILTPKNEDYPSPYSIRGLSCSSAYMPLIYDTDDNEECCEPRFFKGLRTGLILSAILWLGIIYLVVK